jgi:hypothetical protein
MSSFIEKPRLAYYRALLSYAEPKIKEITNAFEEWSEFDEYLIFRRENIHTYEKKHKAVKASKRDNDVYAWRMKKRLEKLRSLPDEIFYNYKDRSGRHKTRAIFVTLTYRRDERLDLIWEKLVGQDFNRWISGLRNRFGKIDVVRVWEAQMTVIPMFTVYFCFVKRSLRRFSIKVNGEFR